MFHCLCDHAHFAGILLSTRVCKHHNFDRRIALLSKDIRKVEHETPLGFQSSILVNTQKRNIRDGLTMSMFNSRLMESGTYFSSPITFSLRLWGFRVQSSGFIPYGFFGLGFKKYQVQLQQLRRPEFLNPLYLHHIPQFHPRSNLIRCLHW
jgi:hypothetical protein